MRTLQKYRDLEATPMAYYKFLTRFALILGLILNIFYTFTTIILNLYWVFTLYWFSISVLNLLSLIWLWKMKWKGVLVLCGEYLLNIIVLFIHFILCVNAGTDFGAPVGGIIGVLVIAIPTWDYFDKRRFLFSPVPPWGNEGEASSEATTTSIEKENISVEQRQSSERPIVYHGIYGEYVQHPIELPKLRKRKEAVEPKELVFSLETNFIVKPAAESKRKRPIRIITIVLSSLLAVSVGLNIWSLRHAASLGNQLDDSFSRVEELTRRLNNSLSKVDELNRRLELKEAPIPDKPHGYLTILQK